MHYPCQVEIQGSKKLGFFSVTGVGDITKQKSYQLKPFSESGEQSKSSILTADLLTK